MIPSPEPSTDERTAYAAERDAAVLQRYRRVNLLALALIVTAAAINAVTRWHDGLPAHLAVLGVHGVLCGLGTCATLLPLARRCARPLVLVFSLGAVAIQAFAVAQSQQTADVMISAMLALMAVPAFVLPWGAGPQLLMSLGVGAGYLAAVPWASLPLDRAGDLVMATLLGICVTTAGAMTLDRQRRATFIERRRTTSLVHQQLMLLEVGRRLNATLDVQALGDLVVRLAQQVVACDVVALGLPDDATGTTHTVVLDRLHAEPVYLDVADDDVPDLRAALERGPVDVPGPQRYERLEALAQAGGLLGVLVVPIRRDGRLLGTLTAGRRSAGAFTQLQRCLVDGIAHQASVALANARLVDDLRHASRVKSDFVSTISHELRTPLNVILGFAEMGCDDETPPAEHRQLLERIGVAGRDLLELIESTLAIGRLEAGRDAIELAVQPLGDLWDDLGASCARLPRKAGVALEWQADVRSIAVATDARKLRVVLRNLVGNALKFTDVGRVRVTAVVESGALVLRVSDTGIGIREADVPKIFDMFRQGDASDTRRFGGTGLGLYIVQQYVHLLGGTVSVASEPGQGSTFTVVLPHALAAGSRDAA